MPRSEFVSRTTKEEQETYNRIATHIHKTQKELLQQVVEGEFEGIKVYKTKPYWADLYGWLSLLINVLTRAAYFPYSNLLKNMTQILSKSPLHLLFQEILDQETNETDKRRLPKAVDGAVGINLDSWRKERRDQFGSEGDYVFARTVKEESDFFKNQRKSLVGRAFAGLGNLTVDVYVANLLKGAKGEDLVTTAILHIQPAKGEKSRAVQLSNQMYENL